MKKLISAICVLLSAMLLFACGAVAANIEFDPDKPWGTYEKSVYEVKIVQRVKSGEEVSDGQIFADGELSYELITYRENGLDYVKLLSDFAVTYRDEEYVGVHRAKTDVITSEVRFIRDGCAPMFSEKHAEYAPRKNSEGKYMDTNSYKYIADYAAKTATSYKGRYIDEATGGIKTVDENGNTLEQYKQTKQFALDTPAYTFDNEQLFFIARAMTTLIAGASTGFSVSNIYHIAANLDAEGKYSATPFMAAANINLEDIEIDASVFAGYSLNMENGAVSCIKTVIGLNTSLPGPAFTAYYVNPEIDILNNATGGVTKKLMLKMLTSEYDLNTGEEAFNTVYTLKEYYTVAV